MLLCFLIISYIYSTSCVVSVKLYHSKCYWLKLEHFFDTTMQYMMGN